MMTALKQDTLDSDVFFGIGIIIEALFDEGPTAGISAYEHADEAIQLYLAHAEDLCNSTAILSTILLIKEHYEKIDQKESSKIISQCNKIINRDGWNELAIAEINSGDKIKFSSAWNIANKLGFDIDDPLFKYIKQNPLDNGYYISTLLKNPHYKDKIIALYEKELPLEKIASGMGDRMGLWKGYEPHRCLLFVLQVLQPYPMMGIKLVHTGLASPVINNRNGSCDVLEAWQASLRQPVSEFSPEITKQIENLIIVEVDEKLKARYKKLIGYNQQENLFNEKGD